MILDGTVLGVGLILFLAAAAQSAVGFGYALFATPLLVLFGIPIEWVIAIVSTCSMLQSFLAAHNLRSHIPWRTSLTAIAIRMVAVIVGLIGLNYMTGQDSAKIRLVVGIALCSLVLLQWLWRPAPVDRVHPLWSFLAFSASGVMSGLLGMGGPPLVLWVMAHRWTPQRSRAFLFSVFAMAIPLQLAMMTFNFGIPIVRAMGAGLLAFPLVYAGTRLGMPIGNRLSREKLRVLAYSLLMLIGVSAIWRAL